MAEAAQQPLLGVILCCTSIAPEERSHIGNVAEEMGAVHKYDLTSDVTHLIVGEYDTPKYRFVAKSRPDVKVVLPSWIEAVRTSWLEGGSTDVEAVGFKHLLPTYHGLKICTTGFFDLEYRKRLEEEIQKAGGQYFGNLTRDVTHLIAKKPGSDKYEFARTNGIKIVSIEWHQQSLERGMILDETLFHPMMPVPERGQGAWERRTSPTTLGKRPRESDPNSQNARKLRRTTSAKFESQNDSLWTDINLAEVKIEPLGPDAWDDVPKIASQDVRTKALAVNGAQDGAQPVKENIEEQRHALKRTQSLGNLESSLWKPPQREAIFHGKHFLLQQFDEKRASILTRHLLSHGAEVVSTPSEITPQNAYLLVPHNTRKLDTEKTLVGDQQPLVVTDLWIERCIHQKRLVPPSEHITSTPFEHFPITGFENMKISSTGFQGIDLLHASKVVKLMGGTYEEYFTDKSTVLVCNAVVSGHEKLRHARLWGIPAVKSEWLWDCIRQGKLLPFDDYLVQQIVSDVNVDSSEKAKVVVKQDSRLKQVPPVASVENPRRNSTSLLEDSKQSKRKSKESRSMESLGKSVLKKSFPDDAGPRLKTSSNISHGDPSREAKVAPQAQNQPRSPLKEVSPNCSPTKAKASDQTLPNITAVSKGETTPNNDARNKPNDKDEEDDDNDTLGPTISSLLTHHRTARSSATAAPPQLKPPTSSTSPQRRRRRQLLGRAPSSHSLAPSLSRTSSIGTMNTDGLGTPLEKPAAAHPSTTTHRATRSKQSLQHTHHNSDDTAPSEDPLKALYDSHDHDPDRPDTDHLQMTQLGYEDRDVKAWRERVAVKMAGGKVAAAPAKGGQGKGGKGGNSAVTPGKGAAGGGDGGIAKRTRASGGVVR